MVKKNREPEVASEPSSEQQADSDDSSSSSDEGAVPSTPRPPSTADKKLGAAQMKPTSPGAKKAAESEEESDSETDSQLAQKSKAKPIDSGSELKNEKSNANPKPVVLASSAAKSPAKRRLPLEAEESKKKLKKEKVEGVAVEEEEGKKSAVLFQRLWSDEDEIVVLQGMVDYKEEKGTDPMSDAGCFHDFIKNSLHVDVDRKQVVDKVRRLKKRYENSVNKKTLTPHEEKANEISKLIWGDIVKAAVVEKQTTKKSNRTVSKATGGDVEARSVPTVTKEVDNDDSAVADTDTHRDKGVNSGGWNFIGKGSVHMGLDENVVKLGLGMCSEDSKTQLEEKWKQIFLEEAALFARKLELVYEESKLVTDALKSGGK